MWAPLTRCGRTMVVAVTIVAAALSLGATAYGAANRSSGKTIVFWHYLTDREQLLQQMADVYQKQTGVTVQLQLLSPDIEAQKFQAGVQAHTLPDLVAAWQGPGEDLAAYAKQGIIYRLDDAMKSWANRFPAQELSAVSFQPGNTFGVQPGTTTGPTAPPVRRCGAPAEGLLRSTTM